MARTVVLGASGFIGTRLVAALARRGDAVVAVDIAPPRVRLAAVTYVTGDVCLTLDPAIGEGADVLYNLAATHRTPGHPPEEYYQTNVLGALHATALAEACGIRHLVFTSSISVYGPGDDLITEAAPLRPVSDYGRSKMMAEQIHRRWLAADPGRALVTVRPGVVFGPGEGGNYTHLAGALRRGLFAYPGRKTTIKSGGYVDELIATLDFALGRATTGKERDVLYNFAYPALSTTEEIVATFGRVAGFSTRYMTLPVWPLLLAAWPFEVLNSLGLNTPIHRERVLKLVQSTRIQPAWLQARGYEFGTDLEAALTLWRDETKGTFV